MAVAFNALETLFHPVTPQAFVHEYWGRRTLFVPGSEAKIRDLLGERIGWDDFFEVADCLARWRHDGKGERAVSLLCGPKALAHRDRVGGFLPMVLVEGDCARDYLDSGVPVTVPLVHWFHPAVAGFISRLTSELVGLRDLNCVFAANPFGGSGVANHFDSFPTLHLQIVGRKRWKVSREPELAWPLRPGVETSRGRVEYLDPQGERVDGALDPSRLETIEVEPGDLIFMPAGTWHQAHPIEEDTLGLELVFDRLSTTEVFLGLIREHLDKTACRIDPPLLLAEEKAPWSLPETTRRFFDARLDELKAFVEKLDSADVDLERVWKQTANGPIPRPDERSRRPIRVTGTETGTERASDGGKRIEVAPDTLLKVSSRGPIKAVFVSHGDEECVHLSQQDAVHCMHGRETARLLRRLVERQKAVFRAADALSWSGPSSWEVVQSSLQTLVERGFLGLADGAGSAPRSEP